MPLISVSKDAPPGAQARLDAFLWDFMVAMIVFAVLSGINTVLMGAYVFTQQPAFDELSEGPMIRTFGVLVYLIVPAVMLPEVVKTRSWGAARQRLAVRSSDGSPAERKQLLVRWLLKAAPCLVMTALAALPREMRPRPVEVFAGLAAYGLLGYVAWCLTKGRQPFYDAITGTTVNSTE